MGVEELKNKIYQRLEIAFFHWELDEEEEND